MERAAVVGGEGTDFKLAVDCCYERVKRIKKILFLLMLACWKETLYIASWVIYTVIVVETDYRTSSLKSRGSYRQLSQLFYNSTPLSCWNNY